MTTATTAGLPRSKKFTLNNTNTKKKEVGDEVCKKKNNLEGDVN